MNEKQLERLAELGTATVYEASGRLGLIDLPLIRVVPRSRVAGPARTVLCGQNDNLMVHACIEHIRPGEVVVLAMPEPAPVALIGDLLVTQMMARGAAAVLTNASVRDIEELEELGLPIWTRYVRVRGASKSEVGRLNVPVTVGGTLVHPGDIVVLDADGAVSIRSDQLELVLEKAEARAAREEALRPRYAAGELSYDMYGFREYVEKNSD
jgi:4-hydroxy-4-methyl-2-oxoglutarate aldolase